MRHARMSSGFGDWKLQKQAEGEGSEADLGGRGLYHGAPCGWPRRHPSRWLRREAAQRGRAEALEKVQDHGQVLVARFLPD